MSTGLAINNVFNSLFNAVLVSTVAYVTFRNVVEYKQLSRKKKPLLFAFGLLLNITAFTCLFVLFWKSFSQLVNAQYDSSNPLFFACNMVFLQHSFLIMVLFVRMYYIFHTTDLELSMATIVLFVVTFMFSSAIFGAILTSKIRVPGTDSWVNCAITLCVFNIIFMIVTTSLFLSKLSIVFRRSSQAKHSNKKDNALINLITKITLLSLMTMSITFVSCLLLLFRFSIFGENVVVSLISDWVISIDIYSNFLCYSLSFKYFHKYYAKLCRCCDFKCRRLWYFMVFGALPDDVPFLAKQIESHVATTSPCTSTTTFDQTSVKNTESVTAVEVTVTEPVQSTED
eukprot:233044_1